MSDIYESHKHVIEFYSKHEKAKDALTAGIHDMIIHSDPTWNAKELAEHIANRILGME